MDQFSAHLDRGWDLVQRGDVRGAEASARKALELDSQSPEVYNLLGYVAALQGEALEAIENYRQAIALDDTYFEAMLNAAEVYIHPLGEYDEAIELCDEALSLAETDDEILDASLLKFDALLGKGETKEAAATLMRLPEGPFENPMQSFLVGRAFYEIGDIERASPLVEYAAKKDPRNAEAWYYVGLVRDDRGDSRGATEAFIRARQLDAMLPPASWSLPRELFAKSVENAVAALDPVLSRYVRNAMVVISDIPGVEVVADGVDPRAMVLLDGLPPPEAHGQAASRVFVYQRNIERAAGSPDTVDQEIMSALEREIAGVFLEGETRQRDRRELN